VKAGAKASIAVGSAALLAFGLFLLNTATHRSDYRPLESGEVSEGIYAIKDSNVVRFMTCSSDFFAVRAGDGLILFDTAINEGRILGEMDKLGLDPGKVAAVFLTHSDREHAKALKIFPNAKVYASEDEIPLIEGRKLRAPFLRNRLETEYSAVRDGEEFDFGGTVVKCIATPGHTPGSMSYLVNRKILFPGDSLVVRDGKVVISKGFFVNMDAKALSESIGLLSRMEGIEAAYTDHYGIIRDFRGAFAK
jgi:glyoxylase-like metal-dependent hydrolase (beta-lactamase superfamily II)